MNRLEEQDAGLRIKKLRQDIPRMVEKLHLEGGVDISGWSGIVDKKLLPRLARDFPLVVAICGGGSSGKSTLFNTLVKENVSPTGGTAGINRRILVAGNTDRFKGEQQFSDLLEPFGFRPQRLLEKHDLVTPGDPLYVLKDRVPSNLILMDTPDFDTGLKGVYSNRDVARQALELSDLFIYIFTNANYNNRDNTDFISEMLTHIGTRKCYLIYRVYSSYGDHEISAHAQTVARNLYGKLANEHVLGVYRADEDNRVASDEKFMDLSPVDGKANTSLEKELNELDGVQLRMDLVATVYDDVLTGAKDVLAKAKISQDELRLYRDALQATQSHCVQEALQHFPMEPVLKRFTEIWFEGDPSHVKFMRKAGNVIEVPLKVVVRTARWFVGKTKHAPDTRNYLKQFSDKVEEDLLSAVNNLWRKAVSPQLSVSLNRKDPVAREMLGLFHHADIKQEVTGDPAYEVKEVGTHLLAFWVKTHPVVFGAQNRLKVRDWNAALESIVSRKETIVNISDRIDRELGELADHFRSRMGIMSRIRQTLSAFLTVLPATAAITYILSTGDPVGAAGIKVKLTGLFGLKDLYALIAIPATTGLKKADKKQLEAMLVPITRTWLDDKLKTIQMLFEEEITGGILSAANQALDESSILVQDIEETLIRIER